MRDITRITKGYLLGPTKIEKDLHPKWPSVCKANEVCYGSCAALTCPKHTVTLGEPFVEFIISCAIVIDVTKEQDEFIMPLQRWLTDLNGLQPTPPLPTGW